MQPGPAAVVWPSLLEKDKWGNWVIHRDYNAAMLAEALCKLEGFTYAPSDAVYWQHGHSTERDFIVTTVTLNHEQLQQLSDEVGTERSLLVLCPAFRGRGEASYSNLTVKKIPKNRCCCAASGGTTTIRCGWRTCRRRCPNPAVAHERARRVSRDCLTRGVE